MVAGDTLEQFKDGYTNEDSEMSNGPFGLKVRGDSMVGASGDLSYPNGFVIGGFDTDGPAW